MITYKYNLGESTYEVFIKVSKYMNNGRRSVQLIDAEDGCPFMTVTVNVPEVNIGDDEVIVKNYSENEGVLDFLIQNGLVRGVKRMIGRGMPVCEWVGEE
jgi:hypothetical protein